MTSSSSHTNSASQTELTLSWTEGAAFLSRDKALRIRTSPCVSSFKRVKSLQKTFRSYEIFFRSLSNPFPHSLKCCLLPRELEKATGSLQLLLEAVNAQSSAVKWVPWMAFPRVGQIWLLPKMICWVVKNPHPLWAGGGWGRVGKTPPPQPPSLLSDGVWLLLACQGLGLSFEFLMETFQPQGVCATSYGVYTWFKGVAFTRVTSSLSEPWALVLAELLNHSGADVFQCTHLPRTVYFYVIICEVLNSSRPVGVMLRL